MDDGGLVQAQVQGIQDWIASGATELAVLSGGSLLLRDAFGSAVDGVRRWLAAAGRRELDPSQLAEDGPPRDGFWFPVIASGTATGVFATAEVAREAAGRLDSELRRRLPNAALDVKAGPFPREWSRDGESPYARARQSLVPVSAGAPDSSAMGETLGRLLPGAQPCGACGLTTATAPPPRADRAQREPWCPTCIDRQRASQRRQEIQGVADVTLAREFREIGAATRSARYRGYMAVIAADGDGIGQRVTRATSATELAAVSQQIDGGVRQSIEAGLAAGVDAARQRAAEASHPASVTGASQAPLPLPYNPVIQAGDDICLVVPADVGLPVAAGLATAPEGLPMSAGVVMCHDSLPFAVALEAADDLKSRAKQASRATDGQATRPHVAFAVESAASVRPDVADDPLQGLAYPADLIDEMRATATALGVAPSRARQVIAALQHGGRVAEREWDRYLYDEDTVAATRLAELYTQLGGAATRRVPGPPPWLEADQPASGHRGPGRDAPGGADAGVERPGTNPFADLVLIRGLEAAA